MIKKEYDAYMIAEANLRKKIFEYFDKLNQEIDVNLRLENKDTEEHFVKISNGLLKDDLGQQWDYKALQTTELLDLWDNIMEVLW